MVLHKIWKNHTRNIKQCRLWMKWIQLSFILSCKRYFYLLLSTESILFLSIFISNHQIPITCWHLFPLQLMSRLFFIFDIYKLSNDSVKNELLCHTIDSLFSSEEGFNVVTVMVHIVNSVVMIIDLFLVAHPVRLLHMHWSLMFAILYLTFSWIYYCAGGLSR